MLDNANVALPMQTFHDRYAQALADAVFYCPTMLAKCAYAMLDT